MMPSAKYENVSAKPMVPTTTLLWMLLKVLMACAGTVEKCEKLSAYTVQIVMSSPGKETWAMKKILRRRMVRKAAMTGINLLNLILSSKAPATALDKQFIIPLTPPARDTIVSLSLWVKVNVFQ